MGAVREVWYVILVMLAMSPLFGVVLADAVGATTSPWT